MATSNIAVTEGSGKNVATNSLSEDAITKQLQRIVSDDIAGNPIFSAVAVLADGLTNPTTGGIQTFPMNYNGTTWDRQRNITTASGTQGTGVFASGAMAQYDPTTKTLVSGGYYPLQMDSLRNLKVTLATLLAGEDLVNNLIKTEQRFNPLLVTADTLVKTGAGFLHTLTFSPNDAAPTAGSVIVYDNTAESGTQIFNVGFTTTWFAPTTVTIDASFSTGLYVGFTTTADVNVTVSYR